MAKKNYYAVRAGRKTGIFTVWDGTDGAKAQVIGFPGAQYKGFMTKEEALDYLAAGSGAFSGEGNAAAGQSTATGSTSRSYAIKAPSTGEILPGDALAALTQVVIARDVHVQIGQLQAVFDELAEKSFTEEELLPPEAYEKLCDRYTMRLSDGAFFDAHPNTGAVAFVDGGGDKSGEKQASSVLPFGVVFWERDTETVTLYRHAFQKKTDRELAWLFHASNVSAEVTADLFVMALCERKGIGSVVIYQDNNLPAKYYSGEFKKIHNEEDYCLQAYMVESIRHLKDGMDIRFVYVPSEHSNKAKSKKAESYEAQRIRKLPFAQAEFYNAVSDLLADYHWGEFSC